MLLKVWAFLALITTANVEAATPIPTKKVTEHYKINGKDAPKLGAAAANIWSCNFDAKKWSTHSPDCLRVINANNFTDARTKILPSAEIFAKGLKDKDIAACRSNSCLKLLTEILTGKLKSGAKIPAEALNALDPYQIRRIMIERAALVKTAAELANLDAKAYYSFLEALKSETLGRLGPVIVEAIRRTARTVNRYELGALKEGLLTSLLSRPETCAGLEGHHIANILSNGKGKSLTAACISKVRNLRKAKPTKLGGAPDGFLSQTNEQLSAKLTGLLDKNKVALMASEVEAARLPGSNLDFTQLKKQSVDNTNPSLKVNLVVGKLNSLSAAADIFDHSSGGIVTQFKGDYFKGVGKEDSVTALRFLSTGDMQVMKIEALQSLIETSPVVCSSLPVRNYKDLSLSGPSARRCFEKAPGKVQAAILLSAKALPDDIAAGVTETMFEDWGADKAVSTQCSKTDCGKYEVLEHMLSERTNNAQIIANFGSDPSGKSACQALGTVEELSQYNKICLSITARCFNAVRDRSFEGASKVHPRLRMLRPFTVLRKDEKLIKGLTLDQMRYLCEVPGFCRGIDIKTFNSIPLAALPALPGACLAQMSFRGELPAATLQALDKDIFMYIPRDSVTINMINFMSGEQLATACTKVADASQNNIGPLLTATVLASLDKKVAFITVTQWKAVPPKSFTAINANLLAIIEPARMAEWTLDQVQEVEKAVWAGLTSAQAAVIGTKAPAEHSPIKYLASLSEIPEDIRAILQNNIPAGAPTAEEGTDYTVWFIIAAVIVGVLIIGGAVYFFMSR